MTNDEVFERFLAAFPTVADHLGSGPRPTTIESRAYTPYVHGRTTGDNWVLVGDAASLLDPVTSSGVATGLNGAFSADRLIHHGLENRQSRAGDHEAHHHLTVRCVSVVDRVVDRVLHRRGLRSIIGTRLAAFVYAITNVLVNAWFTRLQPATRPRMALHGLLLLAAVNLSRMALAIDLARRGLRLISGRRRLRRRRPNLPPRWVREPAHPTPSRSG